MTTIEKNTSKKLVRLEEIKVEVKTLKVEYNKVFKEVFNIILEDVKELKQDKLLKNTKRSGLVTLLKNRYEVKASPVLGLAFSYYEAGISLNLDDTKVSQSYIRDILKYLKNKKISKSFINKSDNDSIRLKIKSIKREELIEKYSKK